MIEIQQHFDTDKITVTLDSNASHDLLAALASTNGLSNELQMLEGALRGATMRWRDEAEVR